MSVGRNKYKMSKYGKYRQFDVQSRFLACEDKARLRAPSLTKNTWQSKSSILT